MTHRKGNEMFLDFFFLCSEYGWLYYFLAHHQLTHNFFPTILFFWLLSVHKYISVDVKKNQYHRCQHKILGIAKEVFVKPNFYFIFFFYISIFFIKSMFMLMERNLGIMCVYVNLLSQILCFPTNHQWITDQDSFFFHRRNAGFHLFIFSSISENFPLSNERSL